MQDHFSGSIWKNPRAFCITASLKKSVKHYSCKDACWVALSLIWGQYSLRYARSNANRFKRVWVSWCVLYFLLQYGKIWLKLLIYCPSDYMVKRKGIQDLISKIFGKGPIWFFLTVNTFHFQWEDLYILKLIWQIRLQVSWSWENGLICIWKVSLCTFRIGVVYYAMTYCFRGIRFWNRRIFEKCLVSQHLFWYFNRWYLMNGGSDP